MPMIADFLQSAFAIDLLFQSPQRFVDRFAFFESNFGQIKFTSSPGLRPDQPRKLSGLLPFGQVRRLILLSHSVNGQKVWSRHFAKKARQTAAFKAEKVNSRC